jgi:hypothetical protein
VAWAPLVTLAPVTLRLVPFEGVLNFRDLGGYETSDGRRTRWGRLFRSDALHDLTDDDLAMFRGLGIAAVVDLRSFSEVERTGRGLLAQEPLKFLHAPVLSNRETDESRVMEFDENYLTRRYLQYLDVGAPAFVRTTLWSLTASWARTARAPWRPWCSVASGSSARALLATTPSPTPGSPSSWRNFAVTRSIATPSTRPTPSC